MRNIDDMSPDERAEFLAEGLRLKNAIVQLARRIGLDGHRTITAMTMALAEVIVLAARPEDHDLAVEDCARVLQEHVNELRRTLRNATGNKGPH